MVVPDGCVCVALLCSLFVSCPLPVPLFHLTTTVICEFNLYSIKLQSQHYTHTFTVLSFLLPRFHVVIIETTVFTDVYYKSLSFSLLHV